MINDLRYAARMMRRAPVFTSAIVLTVAIAVAANTTIFSVVYAVMLRPLPFADPARLMQVNEKNDKLNLQNFGASVLNFLSWREQSKSFQQLGAIGYANFNMSGRGDPEQLTGSRISPSLMPLLGIAPLQGRTFRDDEEKPGAAPVAMIGEGLWKRRFGGDRNLVGHPVTLDGTDYTVVGIAPQALFVLTGGDIWVPLTIDPTREDRLNHVISVIGRLAPGVSAAQAQAEMDAIAAGLSAEYPAQMKDWGVNIITLYRAFVSQQLETQLLVLMCAVGFVLLIACANIANLLLARATAREKEIAVRMAIGAGRGRVVRQLLIESVALSVFGGGAGIIGAIWMVRGVNNSLPPNVLPVPDIQVDPSVLIFALGLTLATGVLFGIAPAWQAATADTNATLKATARSSAGGGRARLRNALAAAELALATMLLIGAGLLLQTLLNLERARLGFDSGGVLTFQLALPPAKYPQSNATAFYAQLLQSLRAMPGVRAAAISSGIPFGNGSYTTTPITSPVASAVPVATAIPIDWRIVSPGFFSALGIPLIRGRDFTDADGPNALPVTIVSEKTAEKFWGKDDPIGKVMARVADNKVYTVVGVVGDVRSTALNQESPALYYPSAARVRPLMDVVVRTSGAPLSMLPTVRQKVRDLNGELPLASVRTLDEWVAGNAAQPRLNAVLLAAFAGVALLIAAIGIYGVIAYTVMQRTREIGLRMALGAPRRGVMRLIVGEGMRMSASGIVVGLLAALAVSRIMASLVYGVPARDPVTFVSVAVALTIVALAACAVPARRASRVDPMVALRDE